MQGNYRNIVLIGSTSERYKGGIAQFTRYLADCIRRDAVVTLISWFQLYPSFLLRRDFRDTKSLSANAETAAEFILGYCFPLSWWRCFKRLRQLSPDLVCISWIHPVHAPVYLVLIWGIRRYTKAAICFICFNAKPHESFPGAAWLSKLVLGNGDKIIVHGASEKTELSALLPEIPITTLYLPERNFFKASTSNFVRKGAVGKRLLFFGMIRHYKGLDILLRALPMVFAKHPDAHLLVAGEVFYQKEKRFSSRKSAPELDVRQLAERLGISAQVTFELRYIGNEEIPAIFNASDVAIFPYRSATQSGVVAVAYGYGVPVIAAKVGGLPDVIAEGVSGMLVEPEDPEQLSQAILKFLEAPISKESVRSYAAQFSWERYVAALLQRGSA